MLATKTTTSTKVLIVPAEVLMLPGLVEMLPCDARVLILPARVVEEMVAVSNAVQRID